MRHFKINQLNKNFNDGCKQEMYVSEFAMIFLNFSKLSSMLLLVLPFPNGVRLFSHSGEFAQIKFGAQFWLSDCLEIRFKIRGHFFKCFELQMF